MHRFTSDEFSEFIEKLPIAIACFDEKRRYIALNEPCAEINGVSHEETIGKNFAQVVPDLVDVLTPIFDRVCFDGEHIRNTLIEGKTPASDKTRYWMASYQPLPLKSGKTGVLVTAEEVTQQVFATKSAETNKRLLTDVLNSLFTFVGLLDSDGILIDANKAPLDAAGIDLKDVKGKYFWDCFWWTYSEQTIDKIKQSVEDVKRGESVRFDIDVRVTDGFLAIDFMMSGLYNNEGDLTHIIPSAMDISERKKTERQLQISQSRFETVINRTVDGLVACDDQGHIRFANHTFETLVGKPIKIPKESIFDYIDDKIIRAKFTELVKSVRENGINYAIENTDLKLQQDIGVLKTNQSPVEIAFSPLPDGDEVLYLATISDVSALYEANKALENALQEKTVLLNEVHHRVKNNLQVMSSLLNLQANAEGTDDRAKEALLDSQRRLKSMALIHQLLYEREDFRYANLQEFTSKLTDLLKDSMANGSDVKIVKEFDDKDITLTFNQIVPYGFLITELVTNAFKHAFLKELVEKPTIKVLLSSKHNKIKLTVSDNGGGYQLNSQQGEAKASLGSDLISIFSRQLHAEIDTRTNAGVTHTVTFANTFN